MQDTYIFKEIPSQRPNTPLLDRIDVPSQLRELPAEDLPRLARELRGQGVDKRVEKSSAPRAPQNGLHTYLDLRPAQLP